MNRPRVLIIDDDEDLARSIADGLEPFGYRCFVETSGEDGLRAITNADYDIILTDLVLKDINGIDVVKRAKKCSPESEIIVITGYPSYETTVEALEEGALDYIVKEGLNIHVLRAKMKKWADKQALTKRNIELERERDKRFGFEGIIGNSEQMQRIFDTLQQVSDTNATVLIYGESGTGKELIARAIHNKSRRRGHHFVPLNCAALSESILESELFGHEKGAFTGADRQRIGRFEFAHHGTLFLDEIGDIPPSVQIKLLRAIEYGEIYRLGNNQPIKVDVRLISATNRRLEGLIKEQRFREDLYYRLKVVTIDIPPLRERTSDIPLLIDAFIKELSRVHGKDITSITPEAVRILSGYPWPGNVRELRNCIENMIVTSVGNILDTKNIPDDIKLGREPLPQLRGVSGISIEDAERELIRNTLQKVSGNRAEAARLLGIGERTLYRKIKLYNLEHIGK
jgi:two-component system response regulator HydG